jgi:DNA-directed RNA polymerase subunit RPC12/RpoP
MSAEARCPNCGALIVGDARWCGQCYAPLDRGPAEAPEPAVVAPQVTVAEAAPAAASASETAAGLSRVQFRKVGEALLWACPQCGQDNPMESPVCSACGTSFSSLLAEEHQAEGPTMTEGQALVSSLAPGLGHIRLGRSAEGVARMILFLWAAGLGVLMLLSLRTPKPVNGVAVPTPASKPTGPILGVAVLFLAAALGIWVISALDAARLARGEEDQLLKPRVLLVGTIVLTVLSIGAFVAAGFGGATAGR